MNHRAIQVQGLGKEYLIGGVEQRYGSFREMLSGALTEPFRKFRKLGGAADTAERFWALHNVTFDVAEGEILGIIGRNGAGKSTLLKVLSRITAPTTGRVVTRGRLASLLEVGTGFHPELTGRENIYLNGTILGMSRREIDQNFDEIVAFSEIEQFLDTPVKRYSSGMYVRLAFAVAAHVDVDILVVDEVLAVGDQQFQRKCINKMNDVSSTGKTVLFVSHNMGTITNLCTRGIMLADGEVAFDGPVSEAVKSYLASAPVRQGRITGKHFIGHLKNDIEFSAIRLNSKDAEDEMVFNPEHDLKFEVEGISRIEMKNFELHLSIYREGIQLLTVQDAPEFTPLHKGSFQSVFRIPAKFLRPGQFSFGLGGLRRGGGQWFAAKDLGSFSILDKWSDEFRDTNLGLINCEATGERQQG